MSRRALIVCPGRGSYRAENLGSLKDRSPQAQAVIQAADAYRSALGRTTVSELDGAERFRPSVHLAGEHASLLTFTCGMADLAEVHTDFEVVGVTGNSMGWYTALAASGALPMADAMRLVETMAAYQAEGIVGGQLLYPVTGSDWEADPAREAVVDRALAEVTDQGHGVWRSIRLGSYAVLAGTEAGLTALTGALPTETRGSRTFPIRLPRHAAFHTPLLAPTSKRARVDLADLAFRPPTVPLIDGRGQVFRPRWADPHELADWTLGAQVTHTYDFTTAVHTALHHTAPDVVILLGPGNSLGAPTAAIVVQTRWWNLRSRALLDARQADNPVLLSFGVPEQAAIARGA